MGIPNAGNDKEKASDRLTSSSPHANNVSSLVKDKLYRKLLTAKRLLVVTIKQLENKLK